MRHASRARYLLWSMMLLGLSGRAFAGDCVDTSPAVAQAAIEDAKRAVLTLEYAPTIAKLEEVRKSLPCLTGTLPTESLAKLYFYEGLFKLNTGDEEGANQAFQDAAAVLPLLQEDREFETKVREKWAAARDFVTKNTGTLVVPNLPKDAIAYVNGTPLQAGVQSTTVYPGAHLLQVWGDDRKLHGTLMRVRQGETSLVPAEFLTSLTPRGELVLDIQPRGSHVVIRNGNVLVKDIPKAQRRQVLTDVKQGAYIIEVSRPGYYPFSRGKVAVEGSDQTPLVVSLKRRPSISLFLRGGGFWVSGQPSGTEPMASVEVVGRTSEGWGIHLEYVYHILDSPLSSMPDSETTNPDHSLDENGDYVNGPPAFPNVTTKGLPLGAQFYIGVSRQFRIEGVDFAVGPKLAMDLYRGSVLVDFSLGYDFVPWFGVNLRAGVGAMAHMSDYIYDKVEDDPLNQYLRFGMVGHVDAGIRGGF